MTAVREAPPRSFLFAPGSDDELLEKVFTAGADAVVLDLEDAVAAAEKEPARHKVAAAVDRRGADLATWVRINGLETGWWREDLQAVVGPGLAGIRIPKAESADDVRLVEEELTAAERRAALEPGSIGLTLTIESAKGVLPALELASCERVRQLAFGAADFAADVRVAAGDEGALYRHACCHLALASAAAGIESPIGPVYTDLEDLEGLEASSERLRGLGFFGRSCIHPRQLAVVHRAFSPSAEQIAEARRIVEAFEEASERSSAVASTADGRFVDPAVVRRARAVLERAEGRRG